jgi:DNA topoisomerase-3
MSKTLVIAEKPSVAADLTRALGGKPGRTEFFEVDDYIITSAVGHLVELCLPNKMTGGKGLSWKLDALPIIPEEFELQPISRSADRFKVVKKLLKDPGVTTVINACDAGREGELIFHNIIQLTGCRKPVKRLWLQSMTQQAIKEGFAHLRDDAEMQPLAAAAVCRSESDWLVGINSTRALTAVNSGQGGFQLTPVGRVQTPTLAILVEREEKIRDFEAKTYFEVHASFAVAAGSYPGRWFDEGFRKSDDEGDADKKAERLWDHARAEAIRAEREQAIAEKAAADRLRQQAVEDRLRRARLDGLIRRGESVWQDIDTEIERRNASGYDRAIGLILDLEAIAAEQGQTGAFAERIGAIRERHARKARFIERLMGLAED